LRPVYNLGYTVGNSEFQTSLMRPNKQPSRREGKEREWKGREKKSVWHVVHIVYDQQ
jgi:hypothetical protein